MAYDAKINVSVTGQQQLDRLQDSLNKTHNVFGNLRTTIAGMGFAALGRAALASADEIQDLANATGIAVGRLKEFKDALATSGGEANDMPKAINTFVRSIDEAAQGSLKAQNSFRELGISLGDLRASSEQELMVKTLDGIARITDKSRQAALMMMYFGKSFKSVDPAEMSQKLRDSAGSGDKYAESIRRGAELNDALATASNNLKTAFLEAFSPMIQKINEFTDATSGSKEKMEGLITTIKLVGIALATAFAISGATGLVAVLGQVGRAMAVISGSTFLAGAFRAMGPFMTGLRGIMVLVAAVGTSIYAASQLFDDFGSIVANAMARAIEAVGDFAASILNLEPISGTINAIFGTKIDLSNPLGNGLKDLVAKARASREEFEKVQKAKKDAMAPPPPVKIPTTPTDAGRPVDTSAYDSAAAGVRRIGTEFDRNNQKTRDQISLDTALIGKSKEYQDITRAQAAATQRTADEIDNLQKAKASMTKDLADAGLGKVYDAEIEKVRKLGQAEQERLANLLKEQNKVNNAEQVRLYGIGRQIEMSNNLRSVQDDMAKMGLSEIEKKYYDIDAAAKASAKSAIEAEAARRGITVDKMPVEDTRAYYAEALKGTAELKRATGELWEQSRTFQAGWADAFNQYVDDATNAANRARDVFATATKGMEDMIFNLVKTGKLEWKSFVQSMIDELLRSEIKRTMLGLFNMGGITGNANSGGGGFLRQLLGFANGGIIPTNQPVLVGERGPEIISGAGGRTVIPNSAMGQSTSITYNISAVDALSFKSMIAADPTFLYAVTEQGRRRLPGGM